MIYSINVLKEKRPYGYHNKQKNIQEKSMTETLGHIGIQETIVNEMKGIYQKFSKFYSLFIVKLLPFKIRKKKKYAYLYF